MKTWLTSRVLARPQNSVHEASEPPATDALDADDGLALDPCCVSSCRAPARHIANLGSDHKPMLLWVCDQHIQAEATARWALHQRRCH